MDRMGGLDGGFLAFESPTSHLHIIGTMVFDPSGVPDGVDFERIREVVARRLPLVPPFRQRLIEVPFGLQHPVLVDDPEFDLDYHLRRSGLPEPGGAAELAELVADVASRPLDRARPLWEFHVVEGLEHGCFALVAKVHHSIIDGVSGAEIMAVFFDLSSVPAPRPLFGPAPGRHRHPGTPADPSWTPEPLPGEVAQWRNLLGSLPGQADALVRTVSRTIRTLRGVGERNLASDRPGPPMPFDAPHTSINGAISSHRKVAMTQLPLADIQRVRDVLGGTTNDVVLSVTSGALRRFFADRAEEPERSLVALIPVSVRRTDEQGALGNRVSAMLVSLASRERDPAKRLAAVREATRAAKDRNQTVGSDLFAGWAQVLFPLVATRATRLATNLRLFDHLRPVFNLIVSNIPGPDFPLYLAGARMVAMYPLGPIIEGAGVNVTVFSYLDSVHVGVLGCWELAPDVDKIAEGMERSLAELLAVANRRDRPVPWWHAELPA